MATDLGKAYVQIIPSAKGISGSISSVISGEASSAGQSAGLSLVNKLKGVIVAAGIGKVLSDSIGAGAEFDKSISQVAATMGLTMNEMAEQVGSVDLAWGEFSGNLREYAQEMGANTAFSATQAADALNYMALAGYDAQTSMEMLPNVLNLAAAGSIDLAYASDMVTDTQTALGLSIERTGQLVDEMAKTASKSNTSVSQLGEAMLTIGATARDLSGGFFELENGESLAYDGTQSLSMALGVLADNGIKGSEGGTHLRNVIMSLTSPTDKASVALENLGVSVYDSEGVMRPFVTILDDLNMSMDGMTDSEKTNIISTIFNKTDIAAVNALLATSGERWVELGTAITSAEGAAQQMADTQLDNLAGDITLFQSALEGAQIALSDRLAPALRDIVQLGANLMSGITSAITSGDFSGLANVGNQIISSIASGIASAPERITMGGEAINGFITGFMSQLPSILASGTQLISNLMQGVMASLPSITEQGFQIVGNLITGILNNLPTLITCAGTLITQFVVSLLNYLPKLLESGSKLLLNVVNGIINNLPKIVTSATQVITKFITTVTSNLPRILQEGILIIAKLVAGLIQAIPKIVSAMPQIISSIKNAFTSVDWASVGKNLIQGIANGLIGGASVIVDAAKNAAKSAFDAAKSYLGINSPATKGIWMGDMYDQGIALGISKNIGKITKATDSAMDDAFGSLQVPQANLNFASANSGPNEFVLNMTINGAEGQDINALADIIQERINNSIRSKELAYA